MIENTWVQKIRKEFPQLGIPMNGKPLHYFDSAATALKPKVVLDKLLEYYTTYSANIHRGLYSLSARATEEFEQAREVVKDFVNANSVEEIIFTRGSTEGINLLAHTLGENYLQEGDTILLTEIEHHANLVPWQMLAKKKNLHLKFIPLKKNGELDLTDIELLCSTPRLKLATLNYVSNALGTINPVQQIIKICQQKNIPVILDAAQAVVHFSVDVQKLDCDFLVFSGHKLFGPTGIGALYMKKKWADLLPPFMGGGDMIETVTLVKSTYAQAPAKFEAGTPPIAEAIALASAINFYSENLKMAQIVEEKILHFATERLSHIPGITLFASEVSKVPIISFTLEGIHSSDVGSYLDGQGICVRVGHHCAMPLMQALGVQGTIRASFSFFNTEDEIIHLADSLKRCQSFFL